MTFAPQLFISNLKRHGDPAKTNRYEIILPIPKYIGEYVTIGVLQQILDVSGFVQDVTKNLVNSIFGENGDADKDYSDPAITRYLSLQCDGTELPGVSLLTTESKIYGPVYKVPYQKQFSDINFSFICTNDFYERKLFDRWIEAIMPNETNNLRFPKGRDTSYMSDITIIQYNDFIKQIYAIKLIDAYPISISPMAVSWSDDGFHRVNVSFAYHKFKTIYKGNYDFGKAIGSAVGTFTDRFINDFSQSILT